MIAPMETEARYSLAELARVTGVTPRTVRYYIAQGLLPGANDAGPGASYDADHLARLRLIRELQRQHLPLAEIRTRLAGLHPGEVAVLLDEQASAAAAQPATSSALDYIRGVLGTGLQDAQPGQPRRALRSMSSPPAPSGPTAHALFQRLEASEPTTPAPPAPASIAEATPPPYETPTAERSQWDRIALTNDIELHVRRPLSRLDNKRVERLITIARQVLGEEQP